VLTKQIVAITRSHKQGDGQPVPCLDNDFIASAATVMWTNNMVTMIRKVGTGEVRRENAVKHFEEGIEG
jgi:hypothetical protein